jgi:hypothetical protein
MVAASDDEHKRQHPDGGTPSLNHKEKHLSDYRIQLKKTPGKSQRGPISGQACAPDLRSTTAPLRTRLQPLPVMHAFQKATLFLTFGGPTKGTKNLCPLRSSQKAYTFLRAASFYAPAP